MDRRDADLAALFAAGLSFAAAACSASPDKPGTSPAPVVSTSAASSASVAAAPSDVAPSATPPSPEEATPTGYAAAFRPVGPYTHALSGLELLGFADVEGDRLVCDGKPCPAEWNALVDGTFARAAVVRKSRTLAVITETNFAQWVGPIDTPEKAALRAELVPGRKLATCATMAEQGLPCASGSASTGAAVLEIPDGYEVATFDERNVCRGHGYGSAVTIGAERVTRQGETQEASNPMTVSAYEKARSTIRCSYPRKGRAYEGCPGSDIDLESDALGVALEMTPDSLHCRLGAPEPRALGDAEDRFQRATAAYFARSRDEEAAAAIAFDRMANELARHGAPRTLVDDARRAAVEERHHTHVFRALLGEAPPSLDAPTVAFEDRSLEALLVENAVEGCANETYAALVATHQARFAPTEALRATFAEIATDERRHADLSHRIHRWGVARLDLRARARVETALVDAIARMMATGSATRAGRELGEPPDELARAAFGWVVDGLLHASRAEVVS